MALLLALWINRSSGVRIEPFIVEEKNPTDIFIHSVLQLACYHGPVEGT